MCGRVFQMQTDHRGQELKLRRVGMTDDQIASLDSRWDLFSESEQAAMKATRKLTIFPHLFDGNDVAGLKQHFKDSEISLC